MRLRSHKCRARGSTPCYQPLAQDPTGTHGNAYQNLIILENGPGLYRGTGGLAGERDMLRRDMCDMWAVCDMLRYAARQRRRERRCAISWTKLVVVGDLWLLLAACSCSVVASLLWGGVVSSLAEL